MKITFQEKQPVIDLENVDDFPILAIQNGIVGLLYVDHENSPWFLGFADTKVYGVPAKGEFYRYMGKIIIESK